MAKTSLRTRLSIISFIILTIAACKCDKPIPCNNGCGGGGGSGGGGTNTKNACQKLPTIIVNGITYRDHSNNKQLDIYDNHTLPIADRVADLISKMSVAEKAGLMMHPTIPLTQTGRVDLDTMKSLVITRHIRTFATVQPGNQPINIAKDNNEIQAMAGSIVGSNRLGIPVSISSNPRNHYGNNYYNLTIAPGAFTSWPGTLGLAAMGLDGKKDQNGDTRSNNTSVVSEFAEIIRKEYRAVGIHISLAPQADIATEPRWGRISGTFGEEVGVVSDMTAAYVKGFQGSTGLTSNSVAAVLKHFPGAGPQKEGIDSAHSFNQEQYYPNSYFTDVHLVPFSRSIQSTTKPAGVMPYYGVPRAADYTAPDGSIVTMPSVAFHYNDVVLGDILRRDYKFDGVVISDWGILNNCEDICITGLTDAELAAGVSPMSSSFGMPWTAETLTVKERMVRAINAGNDGVDQFGGYDDPAPLIEAIESGEISMARIDDAVRRILTQTMQLGLFENSCVNENAVDSVFNNTANKEKAKLAQRASQVLLKNENDLLPMTLSGKKVFVYGVQDVNALAWKNGFTAITNIGNIANADMAIIRINSPQETTSRFPFGKVPFGQLMLLSAEDAALDTNRTSFTTLNGITYQGEYSGSADFEIIRAAKAANIPVVLSIYMERPMIISNIVSANANEDTNIAVLVNFGAEDQAVLDIVNGTSKAQGKLPFDLPRSWGIVKIENTDKPFHNNPYTAFSYGQGIILQ